MNPVILQLGPFALHWYGVCIVGGAVIAAWIGSLYAEKSNENPDHVWNLLAWSLILGIIGARLYHVFSTPADGLGWAYYRENPIEIINFWNGGFRGLGIYGGLVGGIIAIFGYCYFNKIRPLQYLDFMAVNVPLAQAIGRMGNYVNQELYGPPTDRPWAFHINPLYPCQIPNELPANLQGCGAAAITQESLNWYEANGYHPTFFYEAIWNLIAFAILALIIWRFGHKLRAGDGALLYLIAYPLGRFWVEMFRPDAWMMGTMATAQWIAIGSVILSALVLFLRHRNWSAENNISESLIGMSRLSTTLNKSK